MTSVKVKFSPSSVILKEGTVHYQIIHHCKVRHIRTYNPQIEMFAHFKTKSSFHKTKCIN